MTIASRSVRLAGRLFERALRLLPADVYAEFASEMQDDFRQLAERAYLRAGGAGVALVFLRGCFDLLLRAVLERRRLEASEYVRDRASMPVGEHMAAFIQELRYALRGVRKRPGFTLVTVLTLALGIGANVAIFAVVNAVLIRPLPYPESERIVWINHHAPGLNLPDMQNSAGTLTLYLKEAKSFSHIASVDDRQRNLTGVREPARVSVLEATPSLFDVLRLAPVLGRRLVAADARPGALAVAVLSHLGWQRHFAGAHNVIGRKIELDGVPTEIVGVVPRVLEAETEVVVPIEIDPTDGFSTFGMGGVARLALGATLTSAQVELTHLQPRLSEMFPKYGPTFFKQAGWSVSVETLRDTMVDDAETALWVVLGTVGFLLLVACASVANLFLVRAEGRQREVAVRYALGATRVRVAATFLAESLLLGVAGGVWGLLLAIAGVKALVAAGPAQLPRLQEVNVDARVALFAIAISLIAGFTFGVLPLPQHLRRLVQGIARTGRGETAGRHRQRIRKTLIVSQIGLAVVLVTGSGLMLRSFQRLRAVEPGIRPEGVLTLGVSLGEGHSKEQAAAAYQRIIDEIRRLPGVLQVGATNALPLDPTGLNGSSFHIKSRPRADDALPPVAMFAAISSDYLPAIGTTLLQGRAFERADHELKRKVMLVDESFAKDFLQDRALGEHIRFGADEGWIEIVGVVTNVRLNGLREKGRPLVYLPMTTEVSSATIDLMTLVIRTAGDPADLIAAARAAIKRVEPTVPVTTARTMQDVVNDSMQETSFTTTILLIAAIVALLLGAIGLYGVINYVVTQRTSEIGLRIALGAFPTQVRAMVLRQGLLLGGTGVALGLAGAFGFTRVLKTLLFQVDSRDPLTFVIVPTVMVLISALAVYVPARRASSVSPLQALRQE
jgi:putative ABC transport system permease protein